MRVRSVSPKKWMMRLSFVLPQMDRGDAVTVPLSSSSMVPGDDDDDDGAPIVREAKRQKLDE